MVAPNKWYAPICHLDSLSGEGLGTSLQHYNPLVDEEVKKTWKIPSSWRLLAQMPVGSVESPAPEKSYDPIEERLLVFGKRVKNKISLEFKGFSFLGFRKFFKNKENIYV